VVDSAFQMQVIWARLHWGVTLLPAGVQAYHRLGTLGDEIGEPWDGPPARAAQLAQHAPVSGPSLGTSRRQGITYELRIRPESQAPLCHADHYFFAADGRLLGAVTNSEGTGTKALNRLAGNGRR
jgi:hypothetical protein